LAEIEQEEKIDGNSRMKQNPAIETDVQLRGQLKKCYSSLLSALHVHWLSFVGSISRNFRETAF